MIHEALGLTDDIRDYCHRFSAEGYLALAPDLFSRRFQVALSFTDLSRIESRGGQAFRDVEASTQYLTNHARCTGAVGVIGFCMGGGFALLMAPSGYFEVAASKYGRVPQDPERYLAGACPIVGSYGGRDWTERGHAERLEAALKGLDILHDVKEYPEASHSFMNRHQGAWRLFGRFTGFGYHAPSAEDAWQRVLKAFDRVLHEQ